MKVTMAGDFCTDHFIHTYSPRNPRKRGEFYQNWKTDNNTHILTLPGGLELIKQFLTKSKFDIQCPTPSDGQGLQSYATLAQFEEKFRVSAYHGFSGTDDFDLNWDNCDPSGSDLFIIDDSGNYFREKKNNWKPVADNLNDDSVVIYKLSWPLFQKNELLSEIQNKIGDNLIVQLNANGLREEGIYISENLSWERTIIDIITKFNSIVKTQKTSFRPGHILIRLGNEATAYLQFDAKEDQFKMIRFFYFPDKGEGDIDKSVSGTIQGNNSLFMAQLINAYKPKTDLPVFLENAIPIAMASSIEFLQKGYDYSDSNLTLPDISKFSLESQEQIKPLEIPDSEFLRKHAATWTILDEVTAYETVYDIAETFVRKGETDHLDNVAIVEFGNLRLIDRDEIEKFRGIKKLMEAYKQKQDVKRPLNIGVFGPPGSGKSFGVKQIAKTVLGKKIPMYEFNLSQFSSQEELTRALHKIRDDALRNLCPLVFFDEFDSAFSGEELGWLKYFLAPMQDGEFRDKESTHPIGKAIFVFAGGTCSSFTEFSRESVSTSEEGDLKKESFRKLKGPDFVSRLKGYVNIVGVNKTSEEDNMYLIRRAVMLRATTKDYSALYSEDQELHIDPDIIRAMLLVPEYKHGSRSLTSILDMSNLEGKRYFDKSALPSDTQLKLHVDPEAFNYILNMDENFGNKYIEIAKAVHMEYLNLPDESRSKRADHAWNELSDDLQESNLRQARDNFLKLLRIDCVVEPSQGEEDSFKFTDTEISILAEWEHKGWNREKLERARKEGDLPEDYTDIHENLLPWRLLEDDIKEKDLSAVRGIPETLRKNELRIRRLP